MAAVRRLVVGHDRVAMLLSRFRTIARDAVVATVWLNGAPAGRIDLAGELDNAIRNPRKLARLDEEAALSR